MKLSVNRRQRYATMRAHTATHILHAVLTEIFPQTKQAGSYVGPDELRFDFFADRLLDSDELSALSQRVNRTIADAEEVITREMSYTEAIETGAKAFFEEKYPEIVRVVSIDVPPSHASLEESDHKALSTTDSLIHGFTDSPVYSIELCGGTHVNHTGEIGSFVITEQTTVASGVKRIVALTGPRVADHVEDLEHSLQIIADKLGSPVKQLDAKLDKTLQHLYDQSQLIQQLSTDAILHLDRGSGELAGRVITKVGHYENQVAGLGLSFSDAVAVLKRLSDFGDWLVISDTGQYAFSHPHAKSIVKQLGLKGGGSDSFVQGKDTKINEQLVISDEQLGISN